jgi:hypothetical protein
MKLDSFLLLEPLCEWRISCTASCLDLSLGPRAESRALIGPHNQFVRRDDRNESDQILTERHRLITTQ